MAVNKLDPKVIFASTAPTQDTPAVFPNKTNGWGESRKNGGRPTIKQMNALQQETDLKILWLNENAVTPYDAAIDYPINAVTIKDDTFKIFNGTTWVNFLNKSSVGLSEVDNTSDLNKPVSTATQAALDLKTHNSLVGRDVADAHTASSISFNGENVESFIKKGVPVKFDQVFSDTLGGYPLHARIMRDDGVIVENVLEGNTNNPNLSAVGWKSTESKFFRTIADLRSSNTSGDYSTVFEYNAGTNIGGGSFYADTLDTTSVDNGVNIFVAADGTRWKRTDNIINFARAGCVGLGDDNEALKRAMSCLATNGGVLLDVSGMNIGFSENIQCIAPNKKITFHANCRLHSNTSYLTFAGTMTEIGYISSVATQNSRSITLNSSSGISADDTLFLVNTRTSSFNKYRDYYYDGEVSEVLSVSGNVLTLRTGLETSYPSGVDDKVYKLNPVQLDIGGGVTFDGNGYAALRIQMVEQSKFEFNAYNRLNIGAASSAVVFDRVYKSRMTGGRAVKLGLGSTGTDYGISISNCQDFILTPDFMYGHRHAGAMGGVMGDGAIPNRRVYFEQSYLENANMVGIHCADIHGNAINCHYKGCDIKGLVGLGGEECYSIENTISVSQDEIRTPVFMTEVSGNCGSIRDTFLNCGGANNLCGWAASTAARVNDKPYSFTVKDAKIGRNSLIGIMSAVVVNAADSRFILDGYEFLDGFPASITRIVTYAESADAGVTAAKPSFVQFSGNKNKIPDSVILIAGDALLAGVEKVGISRSGSNANGTWEQFPNGTMRCSQRLAQTVTFNTAYQDGFKSADVAWTYPKAFFAKPRINGFSLDGASQSIKGLDASTTTTVGTVFGISRVSYASAGLVVDVEATGRYLS